MPGQYYDSQSGLFYNWNRYYNPATGRYVSSDPIGLDGGLNTFNYVMANPVMYSDSEGLVVELCCAWVSIGTGTPVQHCWVRTPDIEMGYGYDNDTPDVVLDTKVVDHKGSVGTCRAFPKANEDCANKRLKKDFDENFGTWNPYNNSCWTYAYDVIKECSPLPDPNNCVLTCE